MLSLRFMFPVFFTFPVLPLTFDVTVASSITAIPADKSALSVPSGFFLNSMVPLFMTPLKLALLLAPNFIA